MAFGVLSLRSLPSGIYPDIDFPRLVCVAQVGDLPPEVVQTTTTIPLEQALAVVPGARRIRSRTIRGATEISVQLEAGSDVWRALQIAETHVAELRGELPADAELRMERVTPTVLPIVTFNVGGNVDPRVLREAADRIIRPALTRVPGVGLVEVQGGDIREIEVILHLDLLAAAHLTPSQIADRLGETGVVTSVGRAVEEHQVMTVLVAEEPPTLAAIGALPVAMGPNGPVPLSSVASVSEGAEDRRVGVATEGGDVVVVTVSRTAGAGAPDVATGARVAIEQLRRDKALPPGVTVDVVYDQSELISESIHGVRDAILVGIALSLIVLGLFLRDARAGTAAAIAVPITLVCTFGVMRLFGVTLNLMSLGGLAVAIGLVVDDAIVIVEAIVWRLESGATVAAAAALGTHDLFAAVVGTTLTTVVVFAPLGLITGVVGSFFGALAATLCAAVVLSLVVSVTVVPLVAQRLLRVRRNEGQGGTASPLYGRVLRRVVRHPVLSVLAILALLGGGAFFATRVTTGFLPVMDEGAFVLDFFLPAGTSLEEGDALLRRIDHILATTEGITTFTRRTGSEMGPPAATQQNRGDVMVRLLPRDRRASVFEVMDAVRDRVPSEAPEVRVEFVQVLQDVLDDLSGNPRPIEVKFFGPDPATLDRLAKEAGAKLDGVADLEDVFDGVEGQIPTLRADVDARAAARLGVTPATVGRDLGVALGGRVVAHVRRDDRVIGIRVRGPDDVRFRPDRIKALPLAYGGTSVRVSTVADVAPAIGPSVLLRENLAPAVILTAGVVAGGDLGGATKAVAERLDGFALPEGYRMELGGQQEGAKKTQGDLAGVFGLGVALVLAILLVQLRSLRLALVALVGIPLALAGAVAALVVAHVPLNASSLMGFVLLAGLVVKNGILLLEAAQTEAATGTDFAEAMARAGERRLRPILMTTLATLAGLLPLAMKVGAGAELQRPLAIATIGGLVLSTVATLFAVPALAVAVAGRAAPVVAPVADDDRKGQLKVYDR